MDTHVCCSGFVITKMNTTMCLQNGEWELETTQMNSKDTDIILTDVDIILLPSANLYIITVTVVHILGMPMYHNI